MTTAIYSWKSPFGERLYWTSSTPGTFNRMGTIKENMIASGNTKMLAKLASIH